MKLIRADYIFIVSLLLLIGAHTTTNFLLWHLEDTAEKIGMAGDIVYQYEANPIARTILQLEQWKLIFSYAIAPAVATAIYYYTRKLYAKKNETFLEAYAVLFFMMFLLDFMNDLGIVLGVFL